MTTATTEKPDAKSLAPAKLQALPRGNCRLRESVNNTWRAIIPRGTPQERLLESDFWVVVAGDFMPWDRIHAVAEDRSFYAELLVIDAGRGYARIEPLGIHTLAPIVTSQAGLPPGHEIVHAGPDKLYCVRRIKDGVLLGEGFPSKDEALRFLLDHASLR